MINLNQIFVLHLMINIHHDVELSGQFVLNPRKFEPQLVKCFDFFSYCESLTGSDYNCINFVHLSYCMVTCWGPL